MRRRRFLRRWLPLIALVYLAAVVLLLSPLWSDDQVEDPARTPIRAAPSGGQLGVASLGRVPALPARMLRR